MRGMFLLTTIVACCLFCAAGATEDARRGETLPVLNVKYDFPATDSAASGSQGKRFQELVAFKKRGQRVIERINQDHEALTDFLREATQNVDKLSLVLQRAPSFSKSTSAAGKSVQLLRVASSTNESHHIAPPGTKAGLYGEIVSHSDFELNLEPPEVQTRDAQEQLDGLMVQLEAKDAASESALLAEKRHMLNVEKSALRDLVHVAFQGSRPIFKAQPVQLLEVENGVQTSYSAFGPKGFYEEFGDHSDVELNLAPPDAGAPDLETILQAEAAKYQSSTDSVSAAKQRMLNVEKTVLQKLVHSAFLPLLEKIKAVS